VTKQNISTDMTPVKLAVSDHAKAIEEIRDAFNLWSQATGGDVKREREPFVNLPIRFNSLSLGLPADSEEERLSAIAVRQQAIETWRKMTLELIGWALSADLDHILERHSGQGTAIRHRLSDTLLRASRPHKIWPDLCMLVLSRADAWELKTALEALEYGESMAVLRPNRRKGRKMDYTLSGLENEAVPEVYFRHGLGKTKQQATVEVASALGVSPETVRQWEKGQDPFIRYINCLMALAGARKGGRNRADSFKRSKLLSYGGSNEELLNRRWKVAEALMGRWSNDHLDNLARSYKSTKREAKNAAERGLGKGPKD
jgi:hypothetical protein